jgi:hypothetical protein
MTKFLVYIPKHGLYSKKIGIVVARNRKIEH